MAEVHQIIEGITGKNGRKPPFPAAAQTPPKQNKKTEAKFVVLPFLSELVRATKPFRKPLSGQRARTLFRSTYLTAHGTTGGGFRTNTYTTDAPDRIFPACSPISHPPRF